VSGFYEELFPLVRKVNQKLSSAKKLRVLAGDPPIDWSKVKSADDISSNLRDRDASISSVMEKEVLSKHRKALMLFGTFHLLHGQEQAVGLYEKRYPGVTFVIAVDIGCGDGTPNANCYDELDARMASWPAPSLLQLKGTWLADLWVLTPFFGTRYVDAYLYLGRRDLLLNEPKPAEIFLDRDYMGDLQRRSVLMGGGPITDQTNPEKVLKRDSNVFLYDR